MGQTSSQRIRYLRASDGLQLAWADAGRGPAVVKAANWMTHLEYEWESPVWRHWMQFFAGNFRFIRYDERGCGMTDWNTDDLSFERQLGDLEAVVEAANCPEPFTLLGISQGGAQCIRYAVRHPQRVKRLILYGAYAQGWARRGIPESAIEYDAITQLMRVGWGRNNPAFRQIFTSRFVPEASDEQIAWFNDLCLKTASGPNAAKIFSSRSEIDVVDLLPQVTAPTLVLHAREDAAVPLSQGHLIASSMPDAEFIELDSRNHILLEHEPAWTRFKEAVREFMGLEPQLPGGEDPAFESLSPREREILALMTEGLGNAEIAERLSISDKTVRNHVSNVFDKLGVWSRAQAIVFARDRGFSPQPPTPDSATPKSASATSTTAKM
jgi:pimeloyl-ACP methyl ester carboxylesterase/DNA-binding CsgD family transcriptional regulator